MTALVRSPEVPTPPSQSTRTRNAPGERFAPTFVAVLTAAVLVFSVVLRFWTPSPMWLDEALTVDIARAPLHLIPGLLRHDGAPPLYYVLLHFWMKVFGTSDLGARSLSGVIGVLTLPAAWVAGYRIGAQSWREHANVPGEASLDGTVPAADRDRAGRLVAWTVTLLVGTSPFAVYYDTEARMYSLVILLSTLGVLAIVAVLARPTIWNTLALAIITCALEYSHYWALFLVATTALGTAWFAWRGPRAPQLSLRPGGTFPRDLRFYPVVADLGVPAAAHGHAMGSSGGLHGPRLHLHPVRRGRLRRRAGARPCARFSRSVGSCGKCA